MKSRSVMAVLAIAVLVLAAAAAVALGAYNAGVARGIAESGRAPMAPAMGPPYVYGWPGVWGFGFFPVFPLLFFFVFFVFVIRGLVWRGRWGRGWDCRDDRVPPTFDEWHRRAHQEQAPPRPSMPGTA